jgi:DNA-binding beta-propeller fold protein YncE
MLKNSIFTTAFLVLALIFPDLLLAQHQSQLLIASGGAFSDPNDFVEISFYDPLLQENGVVSNIFTQSVQDLISSGDYLYVTATDSVVKIDRSTNQKVASVGVSGANLLLQYQDNLLMTVQYPETSDFLRVFDSNTLELQQTVTNISGETAGMLVLNDLIYVAVPGAYGSLTGSLALLDPIDFELLQEINLGTSAKGIYNLFAYDEKVLCVNKSAYGETTGTLSVFDPQTQTVEHHSFNHAFGKAVYLEGNQLYLFVDNGLGLIDLSTMEMVASQIIPDPGSANFIYFADMVFDSVHQQFYATTTDYFSFGQGIIYGKDGIQKGYFDAGISAEALAVVIGEITSLAAMDHVDVNIFPNPFTDLINVELPATENLTYCKLFTLSGKLVFEHYSAGVSSEVLLLPELSPGLYLLSLVTDNGKLVNKKIMRK